MNPEYIGAYQAYGSVAGDVLLRHEPDEERPKPAAELVRKEAHAIYRVKRESKVYCL
jgi:hypothetical protein